MRSLRMIWKKWRGAARGPALQWVAAVMLTAVLGFCGLLNVWAADSPEVRVYDYAGLFSSSEIEELEEAAAEARDGAGFDAAVMTTDDAEGKSARMYAADCYDALGLGEGSDHSGVLYLIDMDNREIYLLTTGKAIRVLTDDRIDDILDEAYEEAADGDYAASAAAALERVVYYAQEGIVSNQYNYDEDTGRIHVYHSVSVIEFLLALIVSAAVAGGAVMTVKRQYRMEEDPARLANYDMAYRASSEFNMKPGTDKVIDTFVTSMLIASAVSHSGNNHSGRSSSSGRSTTFHSSSGRTHGGGGRKF